MANEKKLDCVILGLLSHESLTGYEIKKRIDIGIKHFWSASFGSIYPTLEGMLNSGMVTRLDTKERGRSKARYTITDLGRRRLAEWLAQPAEKDELRYETLLKLFFCGDAGKDEALGHIERFGRNIEKQLPFLDASVERLNNVKDTDPAHRYYMLTAMCGVRIYNALLEWCGEAKMLLEETNE